MHFHCKQNPGATPEASSQGLFFSSNFIKVISIFSGYLTIDGGFVTVYHCLLIYGNFHLFFFLSSQTENNVALNVVDKKKERKRNFVNAKTGMICSFWLPVHLILYGTLYGLKVKTKC